MRFLFDVFAVNWPAHLTSRCECTRFNEMVRIAAFSIITVAGRPKNRLPLYLNCAFEARALL